MGRETVNTLLKWKKKQQLGIQRALKEKTEGDPPEWVTDIEVPYKENRSRELGNEVFDFGGGKLRARS